jgi:hypothetical protein
MTGISICRIRSMAVPATTDPLAPVMPMTTGRLFSVFPMTSLRRY